MEFLGSSVRKHFEGFGWFTGRVEDAVEVNGRIFGRVKYDDGDCEDLPIDKLREVVVSSTTAKKKPPPTRKKKKPAKQKKAAASGSRQKKAEKPSPAPARKQPARVASQQIRVHYDEEEGGEERAQGIEKTVSASRDEKLQDKKNTTSWDANLRLLATFWDDARDKDVLDNLNEIVPDIDKNDPWMEAVTGSRVGSLRSASDRRIHPLEMSVPKGTRTERKPLLSGEQARLSASQENFTIRSLPAIHRRLRKSLLCVPSKGPVQMVAKPRRGRPPKIKKMEVLYKRPRGRPRKHSVCTKTSTPPHHPLDPSPSDTPAATENPLPQIEPASPSTDVPEAIKGGTAASNAEGDAATTPTCSWKKKSLESRWGAPELPECLGSSKQGRASPEEEASVRSSQNSPDGLPDATSPEKDWEESSRSKRRKTENQPASSSLSLLPVDITSCQDSMANDSDVGTLRRAYEIDQRCPYASKISELSAGMHGPVAPNWRGRPGVCLPTTNRSATSCPTVSFLIRNEIVKLGERLWWKSERGRVLSVGWATVDGILCGRCGWVVDVSGFAGCVGIKVEDPRAHIWAANGMCLLELVEDLAKHNLEKAIIAG